MIKRLKTIDQLKEEFPYSDRQDSIFFNYCSIGIIYGMFEYFGKEIEVEIDYYTLGCDYIHYIGPNRRLYCERWFHDDIEIILDDGLFEI